MTVTFEHEVFIAAPPAHVFDLSLDVDEHLASMAASGERAIAGVTSGRIGLGQDVTWRATHLHVLFTMTSRITELERPHRFVDEQVRGPFRRWRHEHVFEPGPEGTRMVDRVEFDAPLGPIGWAVERLLLDRCLRALISDRAAHLRRRAEEGSRRGGDP
jgi:ligand-binding SRPBCC domain-containing protein